MANNTVMLPLCTKMNAQRSKEYEYKKICSLIFLTRFNASTQKEA